MATEILSFDAIFIPSSERVFLEFRPISRNRWEIGLANYEWNVFKIGKDASSTNNGTSRHEGAPTIRKVAIERRRAGWCPKRFRIPRRIRPSPSEIEPCVEPAFFGNSFEPAPLRFNPYIYKIYTYTYINTYKSRRMRRKVQFDRQTFQRGAKSCSLTDDEYE